MKSTPYFYRLILVFLFAIFCFTNLHGQIIKGVVKDKISKATVPYVNIAVTGSRQGTVTKYDGTFRFDLSDREKTSSDSLSFSCIGYKKITIAIKKLADSQVVFLVPHSVNLESVIVSPRSPEEYIQMAIDNIPQNYINEPFNGTIYFRSEIRLNGMFIESQEAIMKGHIMPVTGQFKDTTRLRMLAYKYFDEQDEAIESIIIKKRKKEKAALEGLDSTLIDLTRQLSEFFGVYTQIDSNLIKQLHSEGYKKGKEKYWFEHMVRHKDRNLMKIGFKGRVTMASQKGNLLLDEESLAFVAYNYQLASSNMKIKAILLLFGIGFKGADVVIQFTSIPSDNGWIPDILDVNVFVEMEKNRWFAKDVPIVIEMSSHMSFLEIQTPSTDKCLDGLIIKKGKHLKEQFTSDPENPLWEKYRKVIENKKRM